MNTYSKLILLHILMETHSNSYKIKSTILNSQLVEFLDLIMNLQKLEKIKEKVK